MTATAEVSDQQQSGSDQVRQAARGSALNIVGALVAAVVSFATVGIITNNYGQVGAGLFFSATAIFTLAANGARLGSESGLTYFVSRLRAGGEAGALPRLIRHAVGSTVVVSTLLAIVGFVSAPNLAALLTSDAENSGAMTTMVRALAIGIPAFAASQALSGASRGFGTMRPSVMAGQIVRPLSQLALVLVAAFVVSAGLEGVAIAWSTAAYMALIPILVWMVLRLRRRQSGPSELSLMGYWRFTGPRAVTDMVSSTLERLDVLLVAYFLTEADAGLYGASARLILVGQMMMFATSQSMAPHLSANFLTGRLDEAKQVLHTVSGWNVTLLWPAFIGLAFGAGTVLQLFGSEFVEGSSIVVLLCIALIIIIGLGVGDTLLLMTGDSLASLINHIAALVIMVSTSALLLPKVGVIGAAWAWALSRIVIRGLAVLRVWQTSRIHAFGRPVVIAGCIALAAYVPTGFAMHTLVGNGVIAIALHAMTGLAIQAALVFRFRDDLDMDQLQNTLRRRPAKAAAVEQSTTPDPSEQTQKLRFGVEETNQ